MELGGEPSKSAIRGSIKTGIIFGLSRVRAPLIGRMEFRQLLRIYSGIEYTCDKAGNF